GISESQERMVLAVPPEHVEELLKLFASEDVDATVIGEFTSDHHLKLFYEDQLVGDLEMEFLHNGIPRIERPAIWQPPKLSETEFDEPADLGKELLNILGSWNTCSKEWVIRQYDHEVQGASILKPLVGKDNDGPGDAAVIQPVFDSAKGVIIASGINTRYGDIDPYWMTASVIDEALRQVIAVGGNLRRVALLDNFCWGNTARPEMLGALVRSAQACHDMALAYGAPFISGKDSLNNEFHYQGKTIAIPHTLLISSVSVIDDVSRTVSMDFKKPGDLIYLVGTTFRELGGSEYYAAHGQIGASVPRVEPQRAKVLMESLSLAIEQGLVRACHDLSEGGLGVALAEMSFAGGLGAKVELQKVPVGEPMTRDDYVLFSESNSRFLAEVTAGNRRKFEKIMKGTAFAAIGKVDKSDFVEINSLAGKKIKLTLAELKEAWQKPLRW
ncbi:MAG: AIR synthase-related protein, partial [Dehalococcoidales bacterium]|nr:AIR synthase-related protein [Dehalococcoidales bacterium]